jgi:hypothetical protein
MVIIQQKHLHLPVRGNSELAYMYEDALWASVYWPDLTTVIFLVCFSVARKALSCAVDMLPLLLLLLLLPLLTLALD